MPIGIQRLNATKTQPSSQIVFIKPLPGPDSAYAQDFLERIAAICHPIMRANRLSIMTLEEHEPNREFIGRNFNAGEIIQLVLKAPYSGNWLSFKSVQMVMVHELAHCQQMNHGKEFWKVNNRFKLELTELWAKNYTGDGLWGRGQTLLIGQYNTGRTLGDEILPASLCGGTFRSRRRKRRRGGSVIAGNGREETYAEAKQRRIAKKFGVNGATLGEDEEMRIKLEYGQRVKGKPRVAHSARGRELRVAAAAARFGQQKQDEAKKEENKAKEEQTVGNESETEDDEYEEVEDGEQAINPDGSKMLDREGHGMVRVCANEDQDDIHIKEEMDELQELNNSGAGRSTVEEPQLEAQTASSEAQKAISGDIDSTTTDKLPAPASPMPIESRTPAPTSAPASNATNSILLGEDPGLTSDLICPICSISNEPSSLLCIVCSHVLNTIKVTGFWRCQNDACKGSQYINAADCGICGVCGSKKPTALQPT